MGSRDESDRNQGAGGAGAGAGGASDAAGGPERSDERIEAAVAAALLGWEDRTAAAGKVEEAERDTAAGLALLSREKVSVRDMATLTGIGEMVCSRLLKMPAAVEPANGTGGADAAG